MTTEQQNEKTEQIDLKDIRKKLEAKIEAALPDEFKLRHESEEQEVSEPDVNVLRQVDALMAKRIVEEYHDGKLILKESSEKGTAFKIQLPLTQKPR